LNLRDLLSVPYLLEAEAVETKPGQWLIRLSYPEFQDCIAEGANLEDVLKELERRRIEMIVDLVEAGREPPIPRKPLTAIDPLWIARDLGLSTRIVDLLAGAAK